MVHTLDPTPNSGNHDKPLPAKRVTEPESDDEEEQRKPEPYQSSVREREIQETEINKLMDLAFAVGILLPLCIVFSLLCIVVMHILYVLSTNTLLIIISLLVC